MKKINRPSVKNIVGYLKDLPLYLSISAAMHILNCFPRSWIYHIGKIVGNIAYLALKDYRNTSLRNLALAYPEKAFEERRRIAKESFYHLGITLLEVLAVKKIAKNIENIVSVETESQKDPTFLATVISDAELKDTYERLASRKGLIVFCGHQANWELPFLFITKNYPGLALAKTIKNRLLNRKIYKLRELYQGKVTSPQNGINKCLKSLSLGHLVGIVGDQALLMSTYSYPLFGNEAWTTLSPALLAYKTDAPVIAINVVRENNRYTIRPSPPLYIDKKLPSKEACSALMDQLMLFLEQGIRHHPEQWMWLHKRWKRKLPSSLKKKFAFSRILITLNEKFLKKHEMIIHRWLTMFKGAEISIATEDQYSQNFAKSLPDVYPENTFFILETISSASTISNTFDALFECTGDRNLISQLKKTGTSFCFRLHNKTLPKLLSLTDNFFK